MNSGEGFLIQIDSRLLSAAKMIWMQGSVRDFDRCGVDMQRGFVVHALAHQLEKVLGRREIERVRQPQRPGDHVGVYSRG